VKTATVCIPAYLPIATSVLLIAGIAFRFPGTLIGYTALLLAPASAGCALLVLLPTFRAGLFGSLRKQTIAFVTMGLGTHEMASTHDQERTTTLGDDIRLPLRVMLVSRTA
jgi:hypothetical protein